MIWVSSRLSPARRVIRAAGLSPMVPLHERSERCTASGNCQACLVEVIGEAEEEGQVVGGDAFFVEGEDKLSATGFNEEVGVFYPAQDSFVGLVCPHLFGVVEGKEVPTLVGTDGGIDSHF